MAKHKSKLTSPQIDAIVIEDIQNELESTIAFFL